jgi:hypothetical protein
MFANGTSTGMFQSLPAIGADPGFSLGLMPEHVLKPVGGLKILINGSADGIRAGEDDAPILPGWRGAANAAQLFENGLDLDTAAQSQ